MATTPTLNERTMRLADFMASTAAALRIEVQTTGNGGRVLDCGVKAAGGLNAGLALARVCLAGQAEVSLVPGDVYEIGYTLSVSVGSESSISLGVVGNFADYSNTGGLIIQELSAANAPVPGNPDILFASGFDYTQLDEPVPEAPARTAGLAGLASLGFVGRRAPSFGDPVKSSRAL